MRYSRVVFCCGLFPVGHTDGGRDILQKHNGKSVVYQVKWTAKPEQDAGGWLNNAIKEEKSIRRLVEEGAKQKRRAVPTLGAARHECM